MSEETESSEPKSGSQYFAAVARGYGELLGDWLAIDSVTRQRQLLETGLTLGRLAPILTGACPESILGTKLAAIDDVAQLDYREASFTVLKTVLWPEDDKLACVSTFAELVDLAEEMVGKFTLTIVARKLGYTRTAMLTELLKRNEAGVRTRKYLRIDTLVNLMHQAHEFLDKGALTPATEADREALTAQHPPRRKRTKQQGSVLPELTSSVEPIILTVDEVAPASTKMVTAPESAVMPKAGIEISAKPAAESNARRIWKNQLGIMRVAVNTIELVDLTEVIYDGDRVDALHLMKKLAKALGITEMTLRDLENAPSMTVREVAAMVGGGLSARR